MKDQFRVGVIGCGLIAQTMHLPVLRELPEARIEALCDISPGTVSAVADRLGVAKRYTDYGKLLADEDVDAVAVLTYDHYDVVAAAISAGKHVLIEKPLAFTVDEGRALVDLAERHDVTAMVGYMKLYDPGLEFATERIRPVVLLAASTSTTSAAAGRRWRGTTSRCSACRTSPRTPRSAPGSSAVSSKRGSPKRWANRTQGMRTSSSTC